MGGDKWRSIILFIIGVGFCVRFAIFDPTALSPTWVGLITTLLFGSGLVSILKKDEDKDKKKKKHKEVEEDDDDEE